MHTKEKVAALSLAGILAFIFVLPIGSVFASPPMNLSFQTSSGNSAGWVTGPGSSSSEAYLTIDSSAPGSFAVIYVHHTPSTLPSAEPSYTPVGYASGTPRIFIFMSDGNYIFIYPDSVLGAGYVSSTNLGTVLYTTWASSETGSGATVTAVYIIADTSQAIPYTAYITSFQYDGVTLIG